MKLYILGLLLAFSCSTLPHRDVERVDEQIDKNNTTIKELRKIKTPASDKAIAVLMENNTSLKAIQSDADNGWEVAEKETKRADKYESDHNKMLGIYAAIALAGLAGFILIGFLVLKKI